TGLLQSCHSLSITIGHKVLKYRRAKTRAQIFGVENVFDTDGHAVQRAAKVALLCFSITLRRLGEDGITIERDECLESRFNPIDTLQKRARVLEWRQLSSSNFRCRFYKRQVLKAHLQCPADNDRCWQAPPPFVRARGEVHWPGCCQSAFPLSP